jgi:hypothetical protein
MDYVFVHDVTVVVDWTPLVGLVCIGLFAALVVFVVAVVVLLYINKKGNHDANGGGPGPT